MLHLAEMAGAGIVPRLKLEINVFSMLAEFGLGCQNEAAPSIAPYILTDV
ncbi:hypothetical protein [Pseudoprimorskyibacter insulae]|nr:hypothetical protein [Pseudoprimorskyibacter insulae]